MGVSKNRGKTPKMDGENNGKPYFLMDDLGVPLFLETPMYKLGTLKAGLFFLMDGNGETTIFM